MRGDFQVIEKRLQNEPDSNLDRFVVIDTEAGEEVAIMHIGRENGKPYVEFPFDPDDSVIVEAIDCASYPTETALLTIWVKGKNENLSSL